MFLKFQKVNKIETKLAFPFIYVGGVTSESDSSNVSCSHQDLVSVII